MAHPDKPRTRIHPKVFIYPERGGTNGRPRVGPIVVTALTTHQARRLVRAALARAGHPKLYPSIVEVKDLGRPQVLPLHIDDVTATPKHARPHLTPHPEPGQTDA